MTVLGDSDDDKWGYAGHTKAKHEILKYYLDPWTRKLGSSARKLRVFDCFAGRGRYVDRGNTSPIKLENISADAEVPGSPLIILDLLVERSSKLPDVECVFIEDNDENHHELQNVLKNVEKLPSNIEYTTKNESFQNTIFQLITETGGWNIPTFFFIDPFGFKDLDYSTITKIGASQGFEILITLMAKELIRWQDVDAHQESFRILYGTDNWKDELESFEPEHWDDKEVEYYCSRLEENGPNETVAYLVTRKESREMIYYLVFGTNHIDGLKIMRDSMQHCGTGRFAYAPKRKGFDRDQTSLFSATKRSRDERIKTLLLNIFEGREISFDKLIAVCTRGEQKYSEFREKHYRSALKELEEEGIVEVERETSKTTRGLSGQDKISFPTSDSE